MRQAYGRDPVQGPIVTKGGAGRSSVTLRIGRARVAARPARRAGWRVLAPWRRGTSGFPRFHRGGCPDQRPECECRAPRSFVAGERLGLEPSAFIAILENVGDAHCGADTLDPALHQLELGVVAQSEGVQPLSLGARDVTRRGPALRVGVRVVPDEGLPVRVTRPFDRVSNLLPGECHGSSLLFTRLDRSSARRSLQGYESVR